MAVDPLDELKRLAYGRGVDATAAATAQAELARLDAARAEAAARQHPEVTATAPTPAAAEHPVPLALPALPSTRPAPRVVLGIAATTLAALVVAIGIPLIPDPSLEIFDRPASARDTEIAGLALGMGADRSTIRWLGDLDEVSAYAYLNASGFVCASLVGPGGLSGSCTSRSRFETAGIVLLATTGPVSGAVELRWGPRGGATLTPVPIAASGESAH